MQEPALVDVGNAHTCCVAQCVQVRLFVAVAAQRGNAPALSVKLPTSAWPE